MNTIVIISYGMLLLFLNACSTSSVQENVGVGIGTPKAVSLLKYNGAEVRGLLSPEKPVEYVLVVDGVGVRPKALKSIRYSTDDERLSEQELTDSVRLSISNDRRFLVVEEGLEETSALISPFVLVAQIGRDGLQEIDVGRQIVKAFGPEWKAGFVGFRGFDGNGRPIIDVWREEIGGFISRTIVVKE